MAGLIFLIPLDMSFSCWFFFFFWKTQLLVGRMLGFRQQAEFPEQSAGAYIALCLIALWMARRHVLHIFNAIFRLGESNDRDPGDTEPLSYNAAVWGLIGGFAFILLFCWQAGMTFLAAGVFFALYLMTQIGITRVRAEVGSPIHDLHFAGPRVSHG